MAHYSKIGDISALHKYAIVCRSVFYITFLCLVLFILHADSFDNNTTILFNILKFLAIVYLITFFVRNKFPDKRYWEDVENTGICPFCKNEILENAIVCKGCQAEKGAEELAYMDKKLDKISNMIFLACIIFIVLYVVLLFKDISFLNANIFRDLAIITFLLFVFMFRTFRYNYRRTVWRRIRKTNSI